MPPAADMSWYRSCVFGGAAGGFCGLLGVGPKESVLLMPTKIGGRLETDNMGEINSHSIILLVVPLILCCVFAVSRLPTSNSRSTPPAAPRICR